MDQSEFKRRTKRVALGFIALGSELPHSREGNVIARQLIRSGTSVGANYRAACRARSPQEMLSKLAIVEEEADESLYWMELLEESGLVPPARLRFLRTEMSELLAMTVASKKTLRARIGTARHVSGRARDAEARSTYPAPRVS